MKEKTCAEIIAESQDRINNSPVLKAACTYSDSVKKPATIYGYGKLGLIEAFQAGAEWQSKQSPWISVEERLPEVGICVLVRTTNMKYIMTSMYIPKDCKGNVLGEKEWKGSGIFKGSITHWMEIPE